MLRELGGRLPGRNDHCGFQYEPQSNAVTPTEWWRRLDGSLLIASFTLSIDAFNLNDGTGGLQRKSPGGRFSGAIL